MLKILHIFTNMNYVYTEALIELFYNYVQNCYHEFLICDAKENVPKTIREKDEEQLRIHYLEDGNIRLEYREIKKYQKDFDYTIYHFLPNDILLHEYYKHHKKFLKNTIWRIWGADLYNWEKKGIQGFFFNAIRRKTRKEIPYVIAEPMDIPEYKKQFGEKTFLLGPDPKGYDVTFLNNHYESKKDNAVYILVGHSAVKTLHHKEILTKLVGYKDRNIKIILPMNYGDMNYAKDVYNYAVSLFTQEKVIWIQEKMDLGEYVKLLWKCDIQIIHSERQIAMGNITMMMYMKKKIFLMQDSIMDEYYRKKEGLDIYNSSEIGNTSFEEFVKNIYSEKNRMFAIEEIDINSIAKAWKETFEFLKSKRK